MDQTRFMKYVKKIETGCWIWIGGKCGKGYGKCAHNSKTVMAHRMSYILFKGEVQEGLQIRHTCDVRKCVNPEHLITGTHLQNCQDAWERNPIFHTVKKPKTGRYKGKYTAEDVTEMSRLCCEGKLSRQEIAAKFGTTYKYLWKIMTAQTHHLKVRGDI